MLCFSMAGAKSVPGIVYCAYALLAAIFDKGAVGGSLGFESACGQK
jgi:hypothetical protein